MKLTKRNPRSGNYVVMVALALFGILGFGALAVDVSFLRFAQGQCQDVADAASQAAVIVLRRTGDVDQAATAAKYIVASNPVAGVQATLDDIEFGIWDDTVSPGEFSATSINPNAAYVEVGRSGSNSVAMFLGTMFGWESTEVRATAVSATRSLQVVLVMDITGSWSQANFRYARDASVAFLQVMKDAHSDYDQLGMTIFTNHFGWEYTPFTYIKDDTGEIAADWGVLNVASKSGKDTDHSDAGECTKSGTNDFTNPVVGGCYPAMPREYTDEPGTDHTTGIAMAAQMFAESGLGTAYRAMVVLTDGIPNGINSEGTARAADGYAEARWREYLGPIPHTGEEIRADSVAATAALWEDEKVHTWVVSFVKDDTFMHEMPRGDGYYTLTTSSKALVDIFEDIALSMPVAIVK